MIDFTNDVWKRPNISGDFIVYTSYWGVNEATGAFSLSDGGGNGHSYQASGTRPKFSFDASSENSTYGAGTVQPSALQCLVCIKL